MMEPTSLDNVNHQEKTIWYLFTKKNENKHWIEKADLGEDKQAEAVEKPVKTFE